MYAIVIFCNEHEAMDVVPASWLFDGHVMWPNQESNLGYIIRRGMPLQPHRTSLHPVHIVRTFCKYFIGNPLLVYNLHLDFEEILHFLSNSIRTKIKIMHQPNTKWAALMK